MQGIVRYRIISQQVKVRYRMFQGFGPLSPNADFANHVGTSVTWTRQFRSIRTNEKQVAPSECHASWARQNSWSRKIIMFKSEQCSPHFESFSCCIKTLTMVVTFPSNELSYIVVWWHCYVLKQNQTLQTESVNTNFSDFRNITPMLKWNVLYMKYINSIKKYIIPMSQSCRKETVENTKTTSKISQNLTRSQLMRVVLVFSELEFWIRRQKSP